MFIWQSFVDIYFWIANIRNYLLVRDLEQRFNRYLESPYQGVYKTVGAWCNQPSFFKKKSLREFGIASGADSARNRYIVDFEEKYPEFKKYMDMKW